MQTYRFAGKNWTFRGGIVADGDHIIERLPKKQVHTFGTVPTNVDAYLTHHLNRKWMDSASGMASRTSNIKILSGNGSQPAFCHLTACRIACAKDKYSFFHTDLASKRWTDQDVQRACSNCSGET